jgi:hypothetical protein
VTTPYGPASLVDEIHEHLDGHVLLAGVAEVTDLDLAPNLQPPSVVVGPPTMTPLTTASAAGSMRYRLTVWVVVQEDEGAYRALLDVTQLVVRVLDQPAGIGVTEWRPTTFPAGGVELPAYAIDIEVISE